MIYILTPKNEGHEMNVSHTFQGSKRASAAHASDMATRLNLMFPSASISVAIQTQKELVEEVTPLFALPDGKFMNSNGDFVEL